MIFGLQQFNYDFEVGLFVLLFILSGVYWVFWICDYIFHWVLQKYFTHSFIKFICFFLLQPWWICDITWYAPTGHWASDVLQTFLSLYVSLRHFIAMFSSLSVLYSALSKLSILPVNLLYFIYYVSFLFLDSLSSSFSLISFLVTFTFKPWEKL